MNTYITLACLLAVLGLSQGSAIGAYGVGAPWYGHALAPAISTANLVKAAPIPVVRTHLAPVVTAPVLRTVAVGGLGYGLGGYGYGGYGLGGHGYGWGGHGLGWGGHGLGWGGHGLGWGGHGLGWGGHGLGWGGAGNWGGYGWGHGLGGKHHG